MTSVVEGTSHGARGGRGLWVALALSLTLNLFVIGGLVWPMIGMSIAEPTMINVAMSAFAASASASVVTITCSSARPTARPNTTGVDPASFDGAVTVVNVWASWCVPCHDEAPLLMQLAQDQRLRVIGINYKDDADNARRFLGRYGNPFAAAGADQNGRAAIEWGVYGVPETFVIGRDARIAYKLVGPITPENLQSVLAPQIEKALAAGS